ncbi:MAG: DNA gyrase/topoisomerase IV subunit A [Saprospiraceae bacterium]|nr:DNA gyrase/topoisomerase IV subunit A [Saprospiraceae bacterium]
MSEENIGASNGTNGLANVHSLRGMYQTYFLDYASYVILERAVPSITDGLKPVQRRILHSMREMHDGRYHKVAGIIGNTMQYHPHGDAAIGDALVKLGQRDLLIDTQGNWGDPRTGDSAAASRYIEARLTQFALDVAFNKDITRWQVSYDGRKNEPIHLPMKFPLVLAQGVEGIAVGLSTKILPHNLGELIKASIKVLEGKKFVLYPDFDTGGSIDVNDYKNGKRGGKLIARAKILKDGKSALKITELPYGVTSTSLIESIVKANDKGKIKIKRVIDNTARDVEVMIELASGVSPDLTIDALYAFTSCSTSISPNACVIADQKPQFLSVNEILRISTFHTKDLLRKELEIQQQDIEQKWHFASLEKIFIENRVYHEIEECETWEDVLGTIHREMRKYIVDPEEKSRSSDKRLRLRRPFIEQDILRLTEIKIKRISKFNAFKADVVIQQLESERIQVQHDLDHLTEYTIQYFENLYDKYGRTAERRTEITSFDSIDMVQVAANNVKLYANLKDGFIGWGLKKDELITECSDLDDIITIKKNGTFRVSRIGEKVFMGKVILHVDVWKKGDSRTTYNMVYLDGKTGRAMAKRFNVSSVTRDRDYDLTTGEKGSKVLYLTCNPNGESETIRIQLSPGCKAKKKLFEFDFAGLDVKGRGSKGNILTRYPVKRIVQEVQGQSTLDAIKIWIDEVSGRLNDDGRGKYLGDFDSTDSIIAIYSNGDYIMYAVDPTTKIETNQLVHVGRFAPKTTVAIVYYEGNKGWTMIKRFRLETSTLNEAFSLISNHPKSKVLFATTDPGVIIRYYVMSKQRKLYSKVDLDKFIDLKGWKALGNKLIDKVVKAIEVMENDQDSKTNTGEKDDDPLKTGDTIEFDLDNGQAKLL